MDFGDGDRALELIQEIRNGTPLGRILGNGTAIVGQVYGIKVRQYQLMIPGQLKVQGLRMPHHLKGLTTPAD